MEFRLAEKEDLEPLQAMFFGIVQQMRRSGVPVWDDVYPAMCFEEDVRRRRLYVLLDGQTPSAAFALCASNAGEAAVAWRSSAGRALYLERLGVRAEETGKGLGRRMLEEAKAAARARGASSLRLFAAVCNAPAIRLYEKNGWERRDGVYVETGDGTLAVEEYGYECAL